MHYERGSLARFSSSMLVIVDSESDSGVGNGSPDDRVTLSEKQLYTD